MGFEARTYKLVFEDPGLAGLEVRARGITIDEMVRLQYLLGLGGQLLAVERADERDELYQVLASGLLGWNLEQDGTPVPCAVERLRAQEWPLIVEVARAWLEAARGVPAPLGPSSNGGQPSEEVSLPMEVLSPSPES